MEEKELMSQALGIREPWYVTEIKFSVEEKRLDIYVDFTKGVRFSCPTCGREDGMAYDRIERTWTRRNSSFTLLFEAFIMTLAKQMSVNAIARLVKEHDTRLWRVLNHYVDRARKKEDYSEVQRIGIDETSSKKWHNYITLFMDLEKSKLIYATTGKNNDTVKSFCEDLSVHKGNPDKIKEVSIDLSPAFIKGIKEHLKQAAITFDRFHVMKIINEAVDKVRKMKVKKTLF